MKKLIIVCGMIFLTLNAFANANWIMIDKNRGGDIFFIDASSIQRSGDSVTHWIKVNFAKRDEFGDFSSKSQDTINCRTREVISRWFMTYDDVDNNGKLTSNFQPKNSWRPISPNSTQWRFYEVVCRG